MIKSVELTLENIECLLTDKPNNYSHCIVFKNNEFLYDFEFDEFNNIIRIEDNDYNIAEYMYDDSGCIISEVIRYPDDVIESFYKIEKEDSIISEYKTLSSSTDKFIASAMTNIKYKYGNLENKYLKKYKLDRLRYIYVNDTSYTVKCLNNGFEVYDDSVPVYRELYNDKDQLIESYILDYNCITNTFKYRDDKVCEQSIYLNRDLLCKISYTYYCNLLSKESICYDNSTYEVSYHYNHDGSISKVNMESCTYKFLYK